MLLLTQLKEVDVEEVTHVAEIMPSTQLVQDTEVEVPLSKSERPLTELSKRNCLKNYRTIKAIR